MNTIFYLILFLIGAVIGRVLATLIKTMSKGKIVHSYCLKCGEKFRIFEKIRIISYIFTKGKCRHCKQKIDTIFIILEIITGILFLIIANGLNVVGDKSIFNMISFMFVILYFSYVILVSGLDKETRNMPAGLLAYGVILSLIYIVYLCIVEEVIYRYIIYLVITVILLLNNVINTKKQAQSSYVIDLLTMLLIMLIFTGEAVCIATITGTLLSISIYLLIKKMKNKMQKGKTSFNSNLKIVFIMGCLNIVSFLLLINIA